MLLILQLRITRRKLSKTWGEKWLLPPLYPAGQWYHSPVVLILLIKIFPNDEWMERRKAVYVAVVATWWSLDIFSKSLMDTWKYTCIFNLPLFHHGAQGSIHVFPKSSPIQALNRAIDLLSFSGCCLSYNMFYITLTTTNWTYWDILSDPLSAPPIKAWILKENMAILQIWQLCFLSWYWTNATA